MNTNQWFLQHAQLSPTKFHICVYEKHKEIFGLLVKCFFESPVEKQWWSNGEYWIKKKINAAAAATHLVQDLAGEWICAICGTCVCACKCMIHREFIPTWTRAVSSSVCYYIVEKNHVQLDNHLSVPSLNKYNTKPYIVQILYVAR